MAGIDVRPHPPPGGKELRERDIRADVTETVLWLKFADVIFGGDKRQPEIHVRLRSQAR